ncbi:sugar kinase [Algoriphagus sanaruensis]|uniref:2-dehydro-3-deoxygluconokinase n=1 Tax=Algoriphagus sanaruensis TaxID=1727163 RepID=A0A142ENX2_9BACT|nr:sugar kinase [Algoriphagus sanaruensis]AMQ56827.1 2-dehydro-3-deoxygluconokinase [Algoriphagus sanaruensis]
MKKIVTLGEVMLRLSPPANQRFIQAKSLDLEFGGSEANVGATLAFWGQDVVHVTAFPEHELGWSASASLRRIGIDTRYIQFSPGRLGVYFLENAAAHRSSQIIYDRADSAFANLNPDVLDWDEILGDAAWLHWSGITPALSANCAEITRKALRKANEKGVRVSGDLNYRSNLWKYGKGPDQIMPELMDLTQVMIAGVRDFNQCLNQSFEDFDSVRDFAFTNFPKLTHLVKTDRESINTSHNRMSAGIYTSTDQYFSKNYDLIPIVDRVGTGDAFAGGLIYGLLHSSEQEAVELGMAACALKHSVPGDLLLSSLEEVQELAQGNSIGKIKR